LIPAGQGDGEVKVKGEVAVKVMIENSKHVQ
jgi:hypothetical protein